MNLRQLEAFRATMRCGSITEAAAMMHISQPSVSRLIADLERAIELSPRHIGALSGRAITLIGLGKEEEGQAALAEALELNPWLPERSLLKDLPGEEL